VRKNKLSDASFAPWLNEGNVCEHESKDMYWKLKLKLKIGIKATSNIFNIRSEFGLPLRFYHYPQSNTGKSKTSNW